MAETASAGTRESEDTCRGKKFMIAFHYVFRVVSDEMFVEGLGFRV